MQNTYNQPIYDQPAPQPAYDPYYDKSIQPSDNYQAPRDYESEERFGFIQKLYGIITVQLVFTFIIVLLSAGVPAIGKFFAMQEVYFVSIVGMLIFLFMSLCFKKKVPMNYIILFAFTTCMAFMISSITAFLNWKSVFHAVLGTIIISVSLTIAVFAMGNNIRIWVCMLLIVGISGLFFTSCFLIFTSSMLAYSLYVAMVGFIYGLYLVIDTLVVKSFYDMDDYIIAAVIIYMDIIRIFLYLLQMFGKKD